MAATAFLAHVSAKLLSTKVSYIRRRLSPCLLLFAFPPPPIKRTTATFLPSLRAYIVAWKPAKSSKKKVVGSSCQTGGAHKIDTWPKAKILKKLSEKKSRTMLFPMATNMDTTS